MNHPILSGAFDVPDPAFDHARAEVSAMIAAEVGGSMTLKMILDNAETQAQKALAALVDADPENTALIRGHQAEVRRCRDIGRWLATEISMARTRATQPRDGDYDD